MEHGDSQWACSGAELSAWHLMLLEKAGVHPLLSPREPPEHQDHACMAITIGVLQMNGIAAVHVEDVH
jgi:hypothetical protein